MRLLRHIVCHVCLLAAWGGSARAEEGRPIVNVFSPKETGGLLAHWITVQDEAGVLYFGSDVLLSFDGERWRQYRVPGGHEIRGLACDAHHRLWVGAVNQIGYFDRTDTGELTGYHSLLPQLPPGTPELGDVWHVFSRGDGAVFVTTDAVYVWDGQAFKIHALPGARRLPSMQVDGQIYVSHLTRGLWRLDADRLTPFISAAALRNHGVAWLKKTDRGWLLVTTDGLARWEDGNIIPFAPEASGFIRENILTSVCGLPGGDLCVGTLNGGLGIIDPSGQLKRKLTARDGLPSMAIYSLFVARDGGLWITAPSGLARIALNTGTSFYDGARGLAGKSCKSVAAADGQIVVATADGIFGLPLDPKSPDEFSIIPSLSLSVHDLLGAGNDFYVGRYKGIDRWHGGRSQSVFTVESDVIKLQRSVSHPENLLVASGFDLARLSPENEDRYSAVILGHLPEIPISIAEDSAGGIWAGTTARGVFHLTADRAGGAAGFRVSSPLGSAGAGLVSRAGEAVVLCTQAGVEFRFAGPARSIVVPNVPRTEALRISNEDPQGRVWIAFASPFADGTRIPIVGRVSLDPNQRGVWEPFSIPGLYELGGIRCIFADARGIIWLGGDDGLLRLVPPQLQPVAAPRPPLIQASMPDEGRLRFDQNTATFDFAALEFAHRDAVRFQTKLSGSADVWAAPSDVSHLSLAGLRDGSYTFAVRVINDAGLTSPEATWHFIVLPPWYRTKLAYTGWSLLALAGFFGVVHWRSAYLHRQNIRLESLVQKKTEQLEKANAAKSEFLANMSHEIRNPISGIVGLSLAMEETALDQRQKTLTDSIRSCATLLATLVDDVLDFSKIEAGRIELRLAPFALRATLAQCADMVREDLRVAGSKIVLAVAADVPDQLVGDSARVQQIVLNYLTNAVKFGAGQAVTLGATALPPDRIRLFVRDQGTGMSESDAASLFTKFTRLERARTHNIRGSGLGLAVCRLLATKMGGAVGVDSKLGEGSCFWAELPLASAGSTARSASPFPVSAKPLHALIVEDIDYNATAMQAVLRKLGITSEVASDGPTALERLQQSFYDVAFMDWNLPGMIGTEVVARYRAVEPANRRTIIIATTAYSADFNREACLQAGMDAFIAKPFTPEKISVALQDLRGSLRAAASVEVRSLRDPTPPLPGIDLELLQLLADESPEGLAGQIDHYLAAVEADRAALSRSIATGEAKEIHRLAHRLASHASMVKFEPLGRLAAEMQAHAATRDPDRLPRLFAEYNREFSALKDRLDALRTSAPPA